MTFENPIFISENMFSVSAVMSTLFLVVSFLLFGIRAEEPAAHSPLLLTHEDMHVVFCELHDLWPPRSIPPSSNRSGLTNDYCQGSSECVEPRVCDSCPHPVCQCAKSPLFENYSCRSAHDCDEGEFCEWEPLIGITSGRCISSHFFEGEERAVLSEPIESIPHLLGLGLTGDRCFSHTDCRGTRSCLGELQFASELHNVTTCEFSLYPCVCTPIELTPCSTDFDCREEDEVCATVVFTVRTVFSYSHIEDEREALVGPLCMSSSLTDVYGVYPVSETSDTSEVGDIPEAKLQPRTFEPKLLPLSPARLAPEIAPFSVPELSFFNSFSINDLGNEFLGGILSVIIVSQLHKIFQSLIYYVPGISEEAYSSYIVFSRFCSFRHIWRTFSTREPYSRNIGIRSNRRRAGINLKRVLLPIVALALLFVAEFSTILAGTSNRREYYAERNFDPIVAAGNGTPVPRVQDIFNEYCDDFFVPTRGIFKSGKVLKCVKPVLIDPPFQATDFIRVDVVYGSGKTFFMMYSQNGTFAAVELSTAVRSESGVNLRTMPFRPDLMNKYDRITFLNSVLNGIRSRLGYKQEDIRRELWSSNGDQSASGRVDTYSFGYRPNWNASMERIMDAVVRGLRDLDLVLNSSGQPWVYTRSYTFERVNPLMAVVKPYRLPHGWLTITAILVTVVHVIVNSYVTHFDDVAYLAMKELIGEDCVLGPLAENNAETAEVEI